MKGIKIKGFNSILNSGNLNSSPDKIRSMCDEVGSLTAGICYDLTKDTPYDYSDIINATRSNIYHYDYPTLIEFMDAMQDVIQDASFNSFLYKEGRKEF